MLDCLKVLKGKQLGMFLGGVLFGTAGVKILGSVDARKCYVNVLAAGLRAKDSVMTTASTIQENAEDIYAEAKEVNRKRAEAADAACVADCAGAADEDDFKEQYTEE